jgi:hypothetical protein
MMKTILIALAILLAAPNFINMDINGLSEYDQKERFNPALSSINSIDELEEYVDRCAALKNIPPHSDEYTAVLAYVISCRFYHGFSHWKLNENWIAAVGQKITGMGLACKVKPEDIMKHPHAACSQQALVMMEILRRKQIDYRKAGFPHHYALEVKLNGHWYFFDPNMEPNISIAQRMHEHWKGENDNLKKYYDPAIHPMLSYQFGNNQRVELGPVNEIPAQNASLFQGITSLLSKTLFCIPLFVLLWKTARRKSMYAVKPINNDYTPQNLTPSFYA